MTSSDQPSILAVCVPSIALDAGAFDLNEILAAREQAALAVHRAQGDSDHNTQSTECDACDDSACGLDVGASPTLVHQGCGDRVHDLTRQGRIGVAMATSANRGAALANGCNPSFFHADSGKKALELLRMLRFDLLVTGDQLPDMSVSHLIRRVRAASPWQKWAMVGSQITTADEIAARTLGAIAVFDAPPDWEVLGSLAAAAAGKAGAFGTSPPEKIEHMSEHISAVQRLRSREQAVAARTERVSRDRSAAVAVSRRIGGDGVESKPRHAMKKRIVVASILALAAIGTHWLPGRTIVPMESAAPQRSAVAISDKLLTGSNSLLGDAVSDKSSQALASSTDLSQYHLDAESVIDQAGLSPLSNVIPPLPAGLAVNGGDSSAAQISAVPEPRTAGLFLLAAAPVLIRRKGRAVSGA